MHKVFTRAIVALSMVLVVPGMAFAQVDSSSPAPSPAPGVGAPDGSAGGPGGPGGRRHHGRRNK